MTSNYSDIAERIADIIIDPDSLYGFADGVISVPTGLMYLGYGYLDTETRYSRSIDKERMVRAVADGLASVESLTEAFETIFDLFNTYVDEANQNAFYRKKAFSFIGKKVTISVITTTLISSLILKSGLLRNIAVKLLGGALFSFLIVGGTVERSCYSSRDLKMNYPEIYWMLYPQKYDLLFFILEPVLGPFIEALDVALNDGLEDLSKIIALVDLKLDKLNFVG